MTLASLHEALRGYRPAEWFLGIPIELLKRERRATIDAKVERFWDALKPELIGRLDIRSQYTTYRHNRNLNLKLDHSDNPDLYFLTLVFDLGNPFVQDIHDSLTRRQQGSFQGEWLLSTHVEVPTLATARMWDYVGDLIIGNRTYSAVLSSGAYLPAEANCITIARKS